MVDRPSAASMVEGISTVADSMVVEVASTAVAASTVEGEGSMAVAADSMEEVVSMAAVVDSTVAVTDTGNCKSARQKAPVTNRGFFFGARMGIKGRY